MAHEILQEYVAAVAKVEAAANAIAQRRVAEMSCRAGCDACCISGLTVLSVEAFAIQEFLDADENTLAPRRGGHACAFLSEAGMCTIYPVRPLLCRTHGLPVRMISAAGEKTSPQSTAGLGPRDGAAHPAPHRPALRVLQDVEVCDLNFREATPLPEDILDAERISALLLVVEQRFRRRAGLPDDLERIALADLCPD